jgi:hypothetical protein
MSHHRSSHQHDFVETAGCGCAARRRQRLATGLAGEECENVNLAARPVLSTVTAACGFARLEASKLQASSYAYPMQAIVWRTRPSRGAAVTANRWFNAVLLSNADNADLRRSVADERHRRANTSARADCVHTPLRRARLPGTVLMCRLAASCCVGDEQCRSLGGLVSVLPRSHRVYKYEWNNHRYTQHLNTHPHPGELFYYGRTDHSLHLAGSPSYAHLDVTSADHVYIANSLARSRTA